ncbi:hypothetical protein M3629_03570 [Paenibacillus polysaccharolyticus]|uniref:hypothetical protein n=1 Tax=Paenibacillus polysaccharolyticus TaxID=582692 RepID=UPI00203A53EA|nr:hypothetical protein [Paenibacillus polysaccharolyticus]MCM3131846.1 hypothetical protein [Paenibacillus polysaccharolyticus]
MDRFEQGAPDPQHAEVVDDCLGCGGEIYRGQEVVKYGDGLCCNFRCLGVAMNAEKTTAGE